MNNTMTRFFGCTISSAAFDLKLGQGVCMVGSVLVGGSTWWKMWRLELTEVQLFFGLLLSLCVPLLLVIIGLLLPIALSAPKPQS